MLIGLIFLTSIGEISAQQYSEWTGSGTTWNNTANWTSGGITYGQLEWKGNGNQTSNNDAGNPYSSWRLYFTGTRAYTLGGNPVSLFDYSTDFSWVLSDATANQILNLNVNFYDAGNRFGQISARNTGSLTFGNIDIGGGVNELRFTGSATANSGIINVGGIISGTGKPIVIGKDNVGGSQGNTTVTFSGSSANTYGGTTTVQAGTLILNKSANTRGIGTGNPTINSGATLRTDANNQLGSSFLTNNGTFNLNNTTQTLALQGNGSTTLGTGSMVIDNTVTNTYSGTVSGGTGASIVKQNSGTQTLSGNLTGFTGGVSITGGTLTLSGTNTYTGGTSVSAGQLNINSSTAIGGATGTLTLSGGNIDNTSGGSITLANNNPQAWNSNFTFAGTQSLNLGTGAVAMSASRTVAVSANTLTVGGVISGSGFSLTKNGNGALTLNGTNTFTGGTTLNAGTLNIGNAQALGTTAGTFTIAGGTIDNTSGGALTLSNYPQAWNGNFVFTGSNNLNMGTGAVTLGANTQVTVSANTLTVGGNVGETGGARTFTKAGNGTLVLSGTNTYSGTTTINAGTLSVASNNALGSGSLTLGNGTLAITGTTSRSQGISVTDLSSTAAIDVASGQTFTLSGNLTGGATNSTKYGKAGAGTLIVSGSSNTYNGKIQIGDGTVIVQSSLGANTNTTNRGIDLGLNVGNVSTSNNVLLQTVNGVTVAQSIYIAPNTSGATRTLGFNGTGSGGFSNEIFIDAAANVLLNAGSGTLTFSGAFINTGGVNVTGGTVVFSGNNTYTGTTRITSGTLQLGAADRISNSSNMILSGGTFSTGSAAGFTELVGTLQLTANSTIALGTGSHNLTFANSSAVSWTGSTTLTITGWTGTAGNAGTAGRIFVGAGGLTGTQLAQITFDGFPVAGAQIIAGGELVPLAKPLISGLSAAPNTGTALQAYNGSVITVTGSNLGNVSGVNLSSGATNVAVSSVTASSFTFVLPVGASGTVTAIDGTNGNSDPSSQSLVNNGYISSATGGTWDASTTTTWQGGFIPPSPATTNVTIRSGTTVTLGTARTVATLILNGTLDNGSQTLTVSTGGTLTNNGGSLTGSTGTVTMAGAATINGTTAITFNNLTINGVTTLTTIPTISGNFTISGGNVTAAPVYGSSSTLIYNNSGGYNVSNEWTGGGTSGGSITAGSGVPNNVTTNFALTLPGSGSRAMAGSLVIGATTGSLSLNGADLFIGGNWTRNNTTVGSFNANGKAVWFQNGNTQVITSASSSESFAYFIIDKSGNNVQLGSGTNVFVTGTTGDQLQFLRNGIDLNNRSFTMSGNGGNILVSGGARSVTGTGNFNIQGTKSFISAASGALSFGTSVQVNISAATSFGNSTTTINGILEIQASGFVNSGQAPTYGSSSTLRYASGTNYSVGEEWYPNTTSGSGVPQNVTVNAGTSINFGSNAFFRQMRGNLQLNTPFTATSSLALSNTSGGDLRIMGDFTANAGATFAGNGRAVAFIGSAAPQTITNTAGISFDLLDINNSNGVSSNDDLTVNTTLTLSNGVLNMGNKILTFGTSSTAVSVTSPSSSKMIALGTSGEVRKRWGLNPSSQSYTFPIGELTTSADYSPATVSFSGTGASGGYVSVRVIDAKHPNNNNSTNFISRYWTVGQSGYTSPTATVTATYTDGDIDGTEASILMGRWTGALPWTRVASSINTSTNTLTTVSAGALGDFTGIRGDGPAVTISGTSSACQNSGLVTLTANPSGGDTPYSYSWSNGLGTGSTSAAPTTSAGTTGYTVTVTDANGISATSAAFNFTVNATPSAPSVGTVTQPTCVSQSSVPFTGLPASGTWTVTESVGSTTITGTGTTGTFTGLGAGSYTFTVTDANGCTSAASSPAKTINAVPGAPTAPTAPADQTICSNSSQNFTFNVTAGSGDQIEWATNAGFTGSTIVSSPAAININSVASGTTVTVYFRSRVSGTGCVSSAVNADATVNPVPTVAAIGGGASTVCAGASTAAFTNATAGGTWSVVNGTGTATIDGSGVLTGVTAGSVTVRYTVTNGTCNNFASASVTVQAVHSLSLSSGSANQTVFVNSAITPIVYSVGGGATGLSLQSGSFPTGVTLSGTTISGTPTQTGTFNYTVVTTGNGCTTQTASGQLQINIVTTEATADFRSNGNVNFTTATNWQYDAGGGNWTTATVAPSSTNNIEILGTDIATVNTNFTVGSGKTFTLTGGSLVINPGVTFSMHASAGAVNFGGRSVTLRSDGTGTAEIGVIPGNGSGLTGATNVTVERYVPARRAWKGLAVPLKGTSNNTIYYNWQNNGGAENGYGALIWKPGGSFTSGDGYSNGGVSANIRGYGSGTSGSNGGTDGAAGFITPSSTKTALLFDNDGPIPYLVFLTDQYRSTSGAGNITGGSSATTLRATGSLFQGSRRYPLSGNLASGFHLIPNPYPSPITLSNGTLSGAGVGDQFWVWDPKIGTVGGYTTVTNGIAAPFGAGSSYPTSSNANNRVIPSGAAFWVKSDGSGALSLSESAKTTGGYNIFSRLNGGTDEIMGINLYSADGAILHDGVATVYNNSSSADIVAPDAQKFTLGSENISLRRNGKDLSVEFRPLIDTKDTIFVRLINVQQKTYKLTLSSEGFDMAANLSPVLQDLFLGTETAVVLNGVQSYNFTVTSNAATAGDRFRIVFRQSAVTPVTDLNSKKGISLYPNPVVKGEDAQIQFRNIQAGKYTVVIYSVTGSKMAQSVVTHGGGTAVQKLGISKKLPAGSYFAEISGENGIKEKIKFVIQ